MLSDEVNGSEATPGPLPIAPSSLWRKFQREEECGFISCMMEASKPPRQGIGRIIAPADAAPRFVACSSSDTHGRDATERLTCN